ERPHQISSSIETSQHNRSRYNLRPRPTTSAAPITMTTLTAMCVLCWLVAACFGQGVETTTSPQVIKCQSGGVELHSSSQLGYEICAENVYNLHEHSVHWNFLKGETIQVIETVCPSTSFCDRLDCIVCLALVANPECWPTGAIAATAIVLYLFILGCYVFLYVPVVLGRPVRMIASLLWRALKTLLRAIMRKIFGGKRRARDLVEILAVACLSMSLLGQGQSSQQIDVFTIPSKVCSRNDGGETCTVHVSEVLKINPFKREACIRLTSNGSSLQEVRLSWNSLILICEPETVMYTRDTDFHVTTSLTSHMTPNVPIKLKNFTFTLSVLTIPVIPRLDTAFITDGTRTAMWDNQKVPPLQCETKEEAETLKCPVKEDCTCNPAEYTVNCKCEETPLTAWINNVRHQLPAVFPSFSLKSTLEGTVMANILRMVTSEIIMTLKDDSNRDTQAEVVCDNDSFTIPCDTNGIKSTLHFATNKAFFYRKCSISCGTKQNTFEIQGILTYPHTASAAVENWIYGDSHSHSSDQVLSWTTLHVFSSISMASRKMLGITRAWSPEIPLKPQAGAARRRRRSQIPQSYGQADSRTFGDRFDGDSQ
ncbi:hypothetical protein OSTOST_05584, partial [Ostertagia ostertagi]